MARLLYNRLTREHYSSFAGSAFIQLHLEGIQDARTGLNSALDLLGVSNTNMQEPTKLQELLAKHVKRNKVLLVIDNVNHANQLDKLLPRGFAEGTKIIITSRMTSLSASRVYQV